MVGTGLLGCWVAGAGGGAAVGWRACCGIGRCLGAAILIRLGAGVVGMSISLDSSPKKLLIGNLAEGCALGCSVGIGGRGIAGSASKVSAGRLCRGSCLGGTAGVGCRNGLWGGGVGLAAWGKGTGAGAAG